MTPSGRDWAWFEFDHQARFWVGFVQTRFRKGFAYCFKRPAWDCSHILPIAVIGIRAVVAICAIAVVGELFVGSVTAAVAYA